jgi:hypothetical protein
VRTGKDKSGAPGAGRIRGVPPTTTPNTARPQRQLVRHSTRHTPLVRRHGRRRCEAISGHQGSDRPPDSRTRSEPNPVWHGRTGRRGDVASWMGGVPVVAAHGRSNRWGYSHRGQSPLAPDGGRRAPDRWIHRVPPMSTPGRDMATVKRGRGVAPVSTPDSLDRRIAHCLSRPPRARRALAMTCVVASPRVPCRARGTRPKHPTWGRANGVAASARSAFNEAPSRARSTS